MLIAGDKHSGQGYVRTLADSRSSSTVTPCLRTQRNASPSRYGPTRPARAWNPVNEYRESGDDEEAFRAHQNVDHHRGHPVRGNALERDADPVSIPGRKPILLAQCFSLL